MKSNPVGWFEIYVQDMPRAKAFYEAVFQGTLEDGKSTIYLRPETAQGMFVDFKNVGPDFIQVADSLCIVLNAYAEKTVICRLFIPKIVQWAAKHIEQFVDTRFNVIHRVTGIYELMYKYYHIIGCYVCNCG